MNHSGVSPKQLNSQTSVSERKLKVWMGVQGHRFISCIAGGRWKLPIPDTQIEHDRHYSSHPDLPYLS